MTDITPQLAIWIEQVHSLAQTGLAFSPSTYDVERYEELLKVTATMAATLNANAILDPDLAERLDKRWRADVVPGVPGYVTPKVGIGAAVFNEQDELLLIKRTEGNWFVPTGWADVGYAPAEVAAKEVREETGLLVTPVRVIGIYDMGRWWRKDAKPYFYNVMFYCQLDGGELHPHPVETQGAGFFSLNALPHPMYRRPPDWIDHAWAVHQGEQTETFFDPA
ncbi:MAG: NUDIX hydrolase N-terminal domain-containing protein [Chloroflexi bacterium]|nr:NUDIX hydrolase N-terminal domain-containing protein [Chloroflexota bacterium]